MDDRTLTALRESIEKWERNAVVESPYGYRTRAKDCALCGLFWFGDCVGCPVANHVSSPNCRNTPYPAAQAAKYAWISAPDDPALSDAAHAAARAEVAFLRSLLPAKADD